MNFDKSCQSMWKFKLGLLNFTNHCVEKSQIWNYFENFINMVESLKDLVTADREGNWKAHIWLLYRPFYQIPLYCKRKKV